MLNVSLCALSPSSQFDACIQETVRLVALSRLVYGDGHFTIAQAYARLAKAYLKFKGDTPPSFLITLQM